MGPKDEQGEAMEPTEMGEGQGSSKQDDGPLTVQTKVGSLQRHSLL